MAVSGARLHALLAEPIPGQAKKDITVLQAKALLASVRPRDITGKTCRRIAAEELTEPVAVNRAASSRSAPCVVDPDAVACSATIVWQVKSANHLCSPRRKASTSARNAASAAGVSASSCCS